VSSIASSDWRATARSLLRWLPGIAVTSLAIFLLGRLVDWGTFFSALRSIPIGIILLSIVIYLVSMVARALCWQFLLQRKASPQRVVLALNLGYFFNNILPFRIGELARAFLLGRRSHLGTFHVLSTIVVERSYDLAIAASLLLITLPLALRLEWARPIAAVLLVVIVAGLIALYLAARNREWVEAWVERLAGRWSPVRRWVLPQLHGLLNGFSVLTRFEFFAGSFGLLALSWFLAILRDWILIRTFIADAPFWWAALGISAANIVGAIPFAMGALGTYELGGTGALTLVGMPGEAALAYILVVHVTHLFFSTLIGAFALSQEGQTLSGLVAEVRRQK
jgi:glycosyltransferase 2 family protein